MLNAKQILVSAFVLAVGMAGLSGCGQTGSLYLPSQTTPSTKASTPVSAPLPATTPSSPSSP